MDDEHRDRLRWFTSHRVRAASKVRKISCHGSDPGHLPTQLATDAMSHHPAPREPGDEHPGGIEAMRRNESVCEPAN